MFKSLAKSLLLLLAGLACGITLVVACGDDGVMDSDAASPCNCEAPLEGRIVRVTEQVAVNGTGTSGTSATCAPGGVLLGGGCQLMNSTAGIHLKTSGPGIGGETFGCGAENTGVAATETLVATAICLMPASM
jgi:hypothetical protein